MFKKLVVIFLALVLIRYIPRIILDELIDGTVNPSSLLQSVSSIIFVTSAVLQFALVVLFLFLLTKIVLHKMHVEI